MRKKINAAFAVDDVFYVANKKERGDNMVELDQFKYTLSTLEKPLIEVRDSL